MPHINRREFMAGLGFAGAGLLTGCAVPVQEQEAASVERRLDESGLAPWLQTYVWGSRFRHRFGSTPIEAFDPLLDLCDGVIAGTINSDDLMLDDWRTGWGSSIPDLADRVTGKLWDMQNHMQIQTSDKPEQVAFYLAKFGETLPGLFMCLPTQLVVADSAFVIEEGGERKLQLYSFADNPENGVSAMLHEASHGADVPQITKQFVKMPTYAGYIGTAFERTYRVMDDWLQKIASEALVEGGMLPMWLSHADTDVLTHERIKMVEATMPDWLPYLFKNDDDDWSGRFRRAVYWYGSQLTKDGGAESAAGVNPELDIFMHSGLFELYHAYVDPMLGYPKPSITRPQEKLSGFNTQKLSHLAHAEIWNGRMKAFGQPTPERMDVNTVRRNLGLSDLNSEPIPVTSADQNLASAEIAMLQNYNIGLLETDQEAWGDQQVRLYAWDDEIDASTDHHHWLLLDKPVTGVKGVEITLGETFAERPRIKHWSDTGDKADFGLEVGKWEIDFVIEGPTVLSVTSNPMADLSMITQIDEIRFEGAQDRFKLAGAPVFDRNRQLQGQIRDYGLWTTDGESVDFYQLEPELIFDDVAGEVFKARMPFELKALQVDTIDDTGSDRYILLRFEDGSVRKLPRRNLLTENIYDGVEGTGKNTDVRLVTNRDSDHVENAFRATLYQEDMRRLVDFDADLVRLQANLLSTAQTGGVDELVYHVLAFRRTDQTRLVVPLRGGYVDAEVSERFNEVNDTVM